MAYLIGIVLGLFALVFARVVGLDPGSRLLPDRVGGRRDLLWPVRGHG